MPITLTDTVRINNMEKKKKGWQWMWLYLFSVSQCNQYYKSSMSDLDWLQLEFVT